MSELVLDKSFFVEVMKDLHEMIEEQRDYLTGLDSEIGDGDHGINLSIGFREVINQLEKIDAETEDKSRHDFARKSGRSVRTPLRQSVYESRSRCERKNGSHIRRVLRHDCERF